MKSLIMNAKASKISCLKQAGKDTDMPFFGIDKDEEYKPEFQTCYQESMQSMQAAGQKKYDELPELLQRQEWDWRLDEETAEKQIDQARERAMLAELKEHDTNIFQKMKVKLEAKW